MRLWFLSILLLSGCCKDSYVYVSLIEDESGEVYEKPPHPEPVPYVPDGSLKLPELGLPGQRVDNGS